MFVAVFLTGIDDMSYKGQQMQCDGDTNGYPYNICTCTPDYVNCGSNTSPSKTSPALSPVHSGDVSFNSPCLLATMVLALISVLLS
jgi:hypothetical protein